MNSLKNLPLLGLVLSLAICAHASAQNYALVWPLSNSQTRDVMTSTFGIRYNSSPTLNYDFHRGIDLSAASGTSVHASYTGTVLWTTNSSTGGIMLAVAFADQGGPYLNMRYLHLQDTAVAAGASVSTGDVVAHSGNTGASAGPHLHLETYASISPGFDNGVIRMNPVRFFPGIAATDAPLIVVDSTYWYDEQLGEVDEVFLHVEIPSTEMDLAELHIRGWDPVNTNSYSQVSFVLDKDTVYVYNNSTTPTTRYATEATSASNFWGAVWCESGNYCCAALSIEPKEFTGAGSFVVSLVIDPWLTENQYLRYYGVQAVDVFGNVREWGSFGTSPKLYVEELAAEPASGGVLVRCDLANCRSLSHAEISRSEDGRRPSQLVATQGFEGRDRYHLNCVDSSASVSDHCFYLVRVFDLDGFVAGSASYYYEGLPSEFGLSQNYPNPFNPSTSIAFTISGNAPSRVDLSVYNVAGQLVRTLYAGPMSPGRYTVQWDGSDALGHGVASGVYFYRLVNDAATETKKMVLLK